MGIGWMGDKFVHDFDIELAVIYHDLIPRM